MQVEADPSDHIALQICYQPNTIEHPDAFMSLSNIGITTTVGGFRIIVTKSQTEGVPVE